MLITTTANNSKKNKQTTSAFRKFFFRPASDRVATESVNLSLPECLELATFTTSCTDEDSGETYFHGQCELSTSPGAYFSNSVGVEWSCWSEDTPRDLLNDGSARDYGFDGACNFRDWYRALKPNDLPECDHVRTDCSSGASWFVGACYSAEFEAWVETWSSSRRWWKLFAAGDCKATAIRESVDGKMYDGACFFEEKSLDVYWWDAVEASKEYSRTVQPSGRRTRRRAHHPASPKR